MSYSKSIDRLVERGNCMIWPTRRSFFLVRGEVRRVEGLIILTRRYKGTQDRISNRWKNRPLKGVKVSRAHLRRNWFFWDNHKQVVLLESPRWDLKKRSCQIAVISPLSRRGTLVMDHKAYWGFNWKWIRLIDQRDFDKPKGKGVKPSRWLD